MGKRNKASMDVPFKRKDGRPSKSTNMTGGDGREGAATPRTAPGSRQSVEEWAPVTHEDATRMSVGTIGVHTTVRTVVSVAPADGSRADVSFRPWRGGMTFAVSCVRGIG